jgi:hypothetical protein
MDSRDVLAIAFMVGIGAVIVAIYGPQVKDAIDLIMSGKLKGSLSNDPILGSGSQPKVLLSSNPGYVYDLSDEAKYEPWALQL